MTGTPRGGGAPGAGVLAACGLAAALLVGTPVAALAHGDPASHYLESDVLYPAFGDRPTAHTELRLLGLLHAADNAGYPLGVALVATEADLTDDVSMLQRPQDYAEYVVAQLGLSRARPVLVITPAGYGLAGAAAGDDGRAHLITRPAAARLTTPSRLSVQGVRASPSPPSARFACSQQSRGTRSQPSSHRPARFSRRLPARRRPGRGSTGGCRLVSSSG